MGMTVEESIRAHFERRPVPNGSLVIVAVSGGQDSLALLVGLAGLREIFGLTLRAAHLQHGQRPEESAREVVQLREWCRALGVELDVGQADVPALARARGESLEMAGRYARYEFLYRTAAEHRAWGIATGHTLDDQAETVLLRVISGTGLSGLSGIAPERMVEPSESPVSVRLFRPILRASRAETGRFCSERGFTPFIDSTNENPRYPRNRIRSELIPILERDFNPAIREALARLAELAAGDNDVLEKIAAGTPDLEAFSDNRWRIDRDELAGFPLALQRRIVRRWLTQAGIDTGYANVEKVLEVWEGILPAVHLEGGLEARLEGDYLSFLLPGAEGRAPSFELPLTVPGVTETPGGRLTAESTDSRNIPTDLNTAVLADTGEPWSVRSRRDGDRIRPIGLGGSRKVADLLTDRKVPLSVRDSLPLVLCGGRIAWIPGIAVDEAFRVAPGTPRVLRVRFEPR